MNTIKHTNSKFRIIGIVIAILFSCLGIYLGARNHTPTQITEPPIIRLFSSSMQDKDGQLQPLSQWKNKTLVINFWATWCTPCVEEIPELSALQKSIASNNTQIIGIGIDSADNIAAFTKKHQEKIHYPIYVGGMDGAELLRSLGNQTGGLPFTVLLGADGKIKKTYLGRLDIKKLTSDLKNEIITNVKQN